MAQSDSATQPGLHPGTQHHPDAKTTTSPPPDPNTTANLAPTKALRNTMEEEEQGDVEPVGLHAAGERARGVPAQRRRTRPVAGCQARPEVPRVL
ncbi:hypothetical protein B0H67DRAFT_388231 [Lasiosphaeris hirsuta]|uniref:Uncharacterized protein n=1 Tax=Lasiosphaeris hirsuta TaxID=260670 RepID=A0AA39ZXU0_9PEZI|nr:hypothetical protein B0H67DRAFT_388231 [Lasiosphaeris hirsuta]